jgi:hypothetical protein
MLETAVARINSFALEPIDHGLADKIGSLRHAVAEGVAIFREDLSILVPRCDRLTKMRILNFWLPLISQFVISKTIILVNNSQLIIKN